MNGFSTTPSVSVRTVAARPWVAASIPSVIGKQVAATPHSCRIGSVTENVSSHPLSKCRATALAGNAPEAE